MEIITAVVNLIFGLAVILVCMWLVVALIRYLADHLY